ncbi:MAG: hypothetical protein WDW36_002836 [Sanguina aurantia]
MLVNQTVSAGNLRRGGAPPGCASAHTRPHRSHPRTWGGRCVVQPAPAVQVALAAAGLKGGAAGGAAAVRALRASLLETC